MIKASDAAQESEQRVSAGPDAGESAGSAGTGMEGGAAGPAGNEDEFGECGGMPCMPKPTFSTLVLSLASSALVQLGEVPDPSTGKVEENLPMAKHSIDILSMLEEKIQKGLNDEESRLLAGLLYELRMKFVVKK